MVIKRKHLQEDHGVPFQPSTLFLLLMKKFALGKISARDVQEVAACAIKSQDSPDVVQLASIGGYGSNPQNCHRDLMTYLGHKLATPEKYFVQTTISLREENGMQQEQEKPIPGILPHFWRDSLQKNPGLGNKAEFSLIYIF